MDVIYDFSKAMEGYILPSKTVKLNMDIWAPGPHNVLYLTALSGSGKTTLAHDLASKYNAKHVDVDFIAEVCDRPNAGIREKLKQKFPEYRKLCDETEASGKLHVRLENDLYLKLVDATIGFMYQDSKNLYVFEGIIIYMIKHEAFKYEPLCIMGTSALTAFWRRLKREHSDSNGNILWNEALKDEFIECVRWYIQDAGRLNDFRRFVKK